MQLVLTPELLIEAYKQGLFPMAYHTGSPYVHWVCPEMRGQLSIENLHVPKSLQKTIRKMNKTQAITVKIDTDFETVIRSCAEETPGRPESWINDQIIEAYCNLHKAGHAHSIEIWKESKLVGGLYGLKIGGAFFGESMFSRAPNTSKIALVHLVARLWKGGFQILDTQFTNPHLEQFGIYELPHEQYLKDLRAVLDKETDFHLERLSETDLVLEYLKFNQS